MMTDQRIQTDFLEVARAAFARGFTRVTPLKNKHPFTHDWNRQWSLNNDFDIVMASREYPHSECGVLLWREIGKPFAIDVDSESFLQRLAAAGPLPETYTVQSRPETEPYKRHIFLRHTEYSVAKFTTHHNTGEYDLIGTGTNPLQVVAEGCVREDTGEVRTGNGLPIADCPEWLADWLIADVPVTQARQRLLRKQSEKEVDKATESNQPIPKGHRTHFLQRLAYWLVRFRMRRQDVLKEITRQCSEYCEDGATYVRTEKSTLRSIAYNPKLHRGSAIVFAGKKPDRKPGKELVLIKHFSARETRLDLISNFPDRVDDVYIRLGLDKDSKKDQHAVSRDMRASGFTPRKIGDKWIWIRRSRRSIRAPQREQ